MSDIVLISLIAILGPCLLAYLNSWQQRSQNRQNWERQDLVADRVERVAKAASAAAKDAAIQRAEVAVALEQSTSAQSADAERIHGRLDEIHAFVNSDMTEALRAQKVALSGQLELLLDTPPTPTRAKAIADIQEAIEHLDVALEHRAHAQDIADVAAARTKAAVAAIVLAAAQAGTPPPAAE